MYGRQVLTWQSGGINWEVANGNIFYRDIDSLGTILCNITTPWGELVSYETISPGECKLYRQTLSSPYREHIYIVKLISSNFNTGIADIQVLSYAYNSNLLKDPVTQTNQLGITNNLPIRAKPGDVLNYNFRISNISSNLVTMRYILAANTNNAPSIITYSLTNCSAPLPPITYTSKKCWYDDWMTPPQECQPKNIGSGIYYDVSGFITMPSTGTEEFTIGIFVEVPNYWGTGKTEWVTPSGFQSGYSISVISDACAGISCAEPVCVYNSPGCYDLYSRRCENGICVPYTKLESCSIVCSATHYLDINIKPHSWYTPGQVAEQIILKLIEIDGEINNILTGITGWKYLGVRVIAETDRVIIRIYLRDTTLSLSSLQPNIVSMAAPIVVIVEKIAIIAVVIGAIIIFVGVIYAIYLALTTLQKLFGKDYTKQEVGDLLNDILKRMEDKCKLNFPNDPVGYANCVKSGVQSTTGAGGDFFKDNKISQAGDQAATKIDQCATQYNIDKDAQKLDLCVAAATGPVKQTITEETREKGGGGMAGLLLLGGLALVGMTMLSKPSTIRITEEKR